MSAHVRRRLRATVGILALVLGVVMNGEAASSRLLVFDVPYERVWARVLRAIPEYPVARVGDGVIETQRVERAPRPYELGIERVAEYVTVHVEPAGQLITRITVDVRIEGLRKGRWEPFEDDRAAVQALVDRIQQNMR